MTAVEIAVFTSCNRVFEQYKNPLSLWFLSRREQSIFFSNSNYAHRSCNFDNIVCTCSTVHCPPCTPLLQLVPLNPLWSIKTDWAKFPSMHITSHILRHDYVFLATSTCFMFGHAATNMPWAMWAQGTSHTCPCRAFYIS